MGGILLSGTRQPVRNSEEKNHGTFTEERRGSPERNPGIPNRKDPMTRASRDQGLPVLEIFQQ